MLFVSTERTATACDMHYNVSVWQVRQLCLYYGCTHNVVYGIGKAVRGRSDCRLVRLSDSVSFNLLKPDGYVMHQQFNIQQLYVLPTLYLRVFYLSENKQRLVPLTA